jgi:hypothetical protein
MPAHWRVAERRDKVLTTVGKIRAVSAIDATRRYTAIATAVARDGPMAVWDVVAQQLENLVESLERKAG